MPLSTEQALLPQISQPSDVRDLAETELQHLAAEIRQRIVDVTAVNGGHLASNLGVVELTLALHLVFDTPLDKLIWDVSHQTYPHKLLTGRNGRFDGMRQFHGLSGFSCPTESEYDHFFGGHAGAALSTALGVAHARDLAGEDFHVVPILGDATLTCGMTFEAMNNLGSELKRFVVVLNDNKMSISKNVGAVSQILSRMISNPVSHRLYQEVQNVVKRMPYGDYINSKGERISRSLKNLVSPAVFFEQYGFVYQGPYDGHDLPKLIHVLEACKDDTRPVLLHVVTNKGQGIDEAVQNPTTYHGVKPFDTNTYKFLPSAGSSPSFPKVFGQHLLEMAEEDPDLLAVTPAMPHGSCLTAFMDKYPERCFDVGIAESHSITYSGGLAWGGKKRVVASIYSSFLQRAMDNVFHDVCLQEIPLVIAIDRAGVSGGDGQMCNGVYDMGFLRSMPNMAICQPRNGTVLKELMNSAFDWGCPTAIRYPNLSAGDVDVARQTRALGKGELLLQGEGILLVPLGNMCASAQRVAEILHDAGLSCSIFDPIFVKPLDEEALGSLLKQHSHVVTMEEHSVHSGLGSAINNFLLQSDQMPSCVQNFGLPDHFVEQGSHSLLLDELGLSPEKMAAAIIERRGVKDRELLASMR